MREADRYQALFAPLEELESFRALTAGLAERRVVFASGPDEAQRAHLIAAAVCRSERPALVVVPNELAAQRMAEDISLLLGGRARALPPREISFLKTAASSRDGAVRRLEVLGGCMSGEVRVLVCSMDAMMDRMMPAERFRSFMLHVSEGMQLEPAELIERLVCAGYERVQLVEGRGQCALRGGILDVYPVGTVNALRIEFFDDEIDTIRSLDVLTQRSVSSCREADIYPASELLRTAEESAQAAQALRVLAEAADANDRDYQKRLEEEFSLMPIERFMELADSEDGEARPKKRGAVSYGARKPSRSFAPAIEALETVRSFEGEAALIPVLLHYEASPLDYLEDPIVVLDHPERLSDRSENHLLELHEQFMSAAEKGQALSVQAELLTNWVALRERLQGRSLLITELLQQSCRDFRPQVLCRFECLNATGYAAEIRELARDVLRWKEDGWRVALLAGGRARSERLRQALFENGTIAEVAEELPDALEPGKALILPFTMNRGFLYPEIRLAIISESDIYGVSHRRRSAPARKGAAIEAFTDLKVGDYVVHEDHGIGQYMGTVRLTSDGSVRDFLQIRYQGSDKLYVPVDQMDRIQKYIGSEGAEPKVNRLSGTDWQRQKGKVRRSIELIAQDLLKLYAARESAKGYAFDADTPWQHEFEESFPFEETPDQLAAIEDIKRDMESERIMDRLLCGDVGYGKTEVALRAVFKAVMSGKQAAILAPTTILVQQHFNTLTARCQGFPVIVESISRFKTAAEQKRILQRLKDGDIDVVIGTHRLLGKDVQYKNLGLLVVDEEQRFGVTHKEAIKKLKANLDVLTLTATPIPRTLHMSMVGIRDMSLLQSPPEERYPVQTYVVEYSDGLIRDAILRELARGGQVYVLYNRVQSIEVMLQRLKKLVPEARIGVGHGQMREHALEDVMMDFYNGKFDVLLCTTIIESGLDVPRANTLIVCDADHFGLSQLYQIRGRVGRSNRLAYAYFTVAPDKVQTEAAAKRLATIREFTEFGSGFRVAMRDLEIRGAGNLLGSEQSGFMASVGYDLYVKMIGQTVRELRGDVALGDIETRVDIRVDAYVPHEYIADDLMRMEIYKKIACIRDSASREDLTDELIDRFGDPPRTVVTLMDIAQLKNSCSRLGIDYVSWREDTLLMRFSISSNIELINVLKAIKSHPELRMKGGNPPTLMYTTFRTPLEELMKGAVSVLAEVITDYEAMSGTEEKE